MRTVPQCRQRALRPSSKLPSEQDNSWEIEITRAGPCCSRYPHYCPSTRSAPNTSCPVIWGYFVAPLVVPVNLRWWTVGCYKPGGKEWRARIFMHSAFSHLSMVTLREGKKPIVPPGHASTGEKTTCHLKNAKKVSLPMMPLKSLDKNIPLAKIKATSVVHTHVLLTLALTLYILQVCVSVFRCLKFRRSPSSRCQICRYVF